MKVWTVVGLVALGGVVGCASDGVEPGAMAVEGVPVPGADHEVRDLTEVSVPVVVDGGSKLDGSVRTFVPWDSKAELVVSRAGDGLGVGDGALVVRYGKSWEMDEGRCSTVYVLEDEAEAIEPLELRWRPGTGAEMWAYARVDGAILAYPLDR